MLKHRPKRLAAARGLRDDDPLTQAAHRRRPRSSFGVRANAVAGESGAEWVASMNCTGDWVEGARVEK
jgi:hypothetical protein